MSAIPTATPAPDPDAPRWLTLREAAALYCISVDTLRRCIARGELRAVYLRKRIIRVLSTDLDDLFKEFPGRPGPKDRR